MMDDPSWRDGLPFVLWGAQQVVHRRVQQEVADLGVTITQLGLVVHLDELGHMSASDLARRFRLTPQSVATALGRLEDEGWVRRLPHPVHRKVVWYELTETGAGGVERARARMGRVTAQIDELIGPDLRNTLVTGLRELVVAMDDGRSADAPMWSVRD